MFIVLEKAINGFIIRLVTHNGIFSFVYKTARSCKKCIEWLQKLNARVIKSSSDLYLQILLEVN